MPERSITVANDEVICGLIRQAQRRVVVLAPAVSMTVAAAIIDRWPELGADAISVILDVDPEVYRLGYGDPKALTLLEAKASEFGTMLQRQEGIRVGLIIADAAMMIFAPTPVLIEAGPVVAQNPKTIRPNAILLSSPAEGVLRELGLGENADQVIGLDKATRADIHTLEQDLLSNPPQRFDIARSLRVFNAAFEFVELELVGTSIDRKTVRIPPHLSGIADIQTQDRLRTSFAVVRPNDKLSGEHLKKDRDLIAKKYLRSIKSHGNVILRSNKAAFEKEVNDLRVSIAEFAETVRVELQAAMDRNREGLVESMLPLVRQNTPTNWIKSNGTKPDDQTLRDFLDKDLRRAFGTADGLIGKMEVCCIFKGVTYESLTNTEFLAAAKMAIPELQYMYEEFDAARGTTEAEKKPA